MIKEVYTGHPLQRFVDRFIGHGIFRREYQVPDVIDFTIDQPRGIVLVYQGPKHNFTHSIRTAQGTKIDFATLAPFPIGFTIEDSKFEDYSIHRNKRKVGIPRNLRGLIRDPALGTLHEIGHFWSYYDEEWRKSNETALALINDRSIPRSNREDNLPFDRARRKQEIDAWNNYLEEERRAWGAALYIVYRLRQVGIDLVPHRKNVSALIKDANRYLKTKCKKFEEINMNKIELDPRFSNGEAVNFAAGNFPWPELRALIDQQFDHEFPLAA